MQYTNCVNNSKSILLSIWSAHKRSFTIHCHYFSPCHNHLPFIFHLHSTIGNREQQFPFTICAPKHITTDCVLCACNLWPQFARANTTEDQFWWSIIRTSQHNQGSILVINFGDQHSILSILLPHTISHTQDHISYYVTGKKGEIPTVFSRDTLVSGYYIFFLSTEFEYIVHH